MCRRDAQAIANMIDEIIKQAEEKYDHQSLSSLEVTSFIRDKFEKRYDSWYGDDND